MDDATREIGPEGQRRKKSKLAFLSPSQRTEALGRLGHYEVLEVLGQGAFGIVLRAFDETLQRVVAVKVLAPELAATSPARKRFLREARAAAQLRHENVVQVHAIEEAPLPYLVMEYVPGETLQLRMETVGPLSLEEAVQIGIQIARGLAAAHEKGLIHRDVKPANVLLEKGAEGRVKLTDFGLARAADDASLTQSGVVAGTPQYMSPEQARGERPDHRTDLFSLGSVLYAMVSGRLPFRAPNPIAVLQRVCDDTPRSIRDIIPEVPQWLCDVIAKLHAKDPAKRFQTAREVVEVLVKGPSAPPDSAMRGRSRRPALAVVGVLVILLAAAGIYWAQRGALPARPGLIAKQPEAADKHSRPPASDLALVFDGREHTALADSLVRDTDSPVTLEVWYKMFSPTPTYRTILALGGNEAVWIANSPDTIAPLSLRLPAPPNNFALQGGKLRFGAWTHVALVYDQRATRFYLDGTMQSNTPRLDAPRNPQKWPVGGLIFGSTRYAAEGQVSQFVGQLDEIRVSKTARYEANFTPLRRFETDADTLALYHCDEGKGEQLIDASGNGHHATLAGVTWVGVVP